MTNKNNPLFNSLSEVTNYCTNTPVLHASVDLLEELVLHHEYVGDPSEECPYDSAMRGDLEAFFHTCLDIQELYNNVVETLWNVSEDDPRLGELIKVHDRLLREYGAKHYRM